MKLEITTKINVTNEDINGIVSCALDGGITYWCGKATPKGEHLGEYLGEYASEQISKGGSLLLEASAGGTYTLTRENLLKGIQMYLSKHSTPIANGYLDLCYIDALAADCIIQYALFGKLIYG